MGITIGEARDVSQVILSPHNVKNVVSNHMFVYQHQDIFRQALEERRLELVVAKWRRLGGVNDGRVDAVS